MMQRCYFSAIAICSLLIGCGKDDDKKNRGGVLPLVNPIVERSIPDSFREGGGALALNDSVSPGENIQHFVTRNSMSIFSGKIRSGVVRQALEDLDERIAEVDGSLSPDDVGCLGATAEDMVGDSGFENHRVALKISCYRSVVGGPAGAGSGLAFGQDEDFTYLSFILTQAAKQDSQKTGFWAKINRETEDVDFLFLEHFEVDDGGIRRQFFRIKANPNDQLFQFAGSGNGVTYGPLAAGSSGQSSDYASLGSGTRMASNAKFVVVEGTACSTSDEANICNAGKQITYASGSCFSATDFSTKEDSSCSAVTFSEDFSLVDSGGYYDEEELNSDAAAALLSSFNVDSVINSVSSF